MRKALWVVRDKITTPQAVDDLIEASATRAIFDLGIETSTLPALVEDIHNLAQVYEESIELQKVMSNPLVAEEQRLATWCDAIVMTRGYPHLQGAEGEPSRSRSRADDHADGAFDLERRPGLDAEHHRTRQ